MDQPKRCVLAGGGMAVAVLVGMLSGCGTDPARPDQPRAEASLPMERTPTTTALTSTTAPISRNSLEWAHRMLIIFAEEERDPRLEEQRRALGPGTKGLEERDIRVIEIVGTDPLRDSLILPLDGFHVVLIGRDGLVKLREEQVVPVKRILELVDSMPMRQREMRERGAR